MILELLGHEIARTRREHGCTTILLADLDHFKQVNDTYGHMVGDEVLREVARRLLSCVRSYDFVGRYGGEEFLMVLNNCSEEKALDRGEEVRRIIAAAPIKTSAGPLSITVSVGALASRQWESCQAGRSLPRSRYGSLCRQGRGPELLPAGHPG